MPAKRAAPPARLSCGAIFVKPFPARSGAILSYSGLVGNFGSCRKSLVFKAEAIIPVDIEYDGNVHFRRVFCFAVGLTMAPARPLHLPRRRFPGFGFPIASDLVPRAVCTQVDSFCFSFGEAIHKEGREGRCGSSAERPDEVGARQTETRRAGPVWVKSVGLRLVRAASPACDKALDLGPNHRRQNGST
ncbi:hypothetical protein RB623_15920 [Mesorhizobium sp. LHD-90]|uniref:hypothetical protein n=1 Tax=Mesorhizobium sp. LHD-90 TaxID=3071414 RepID=UPI0027E0D182|nr:hypothetical protein [Mesorhizobium sp. LHD-90]MDQ6435545.1 hypothetical protein [Mesorhizobium sp. LHD-90]